VTASLITIAGGTHDFWNVGLPLPSDGRSRQRNRQRPSTYNATAHNRRKSLEREAGGRVQIACLSPAAVSAPAAVAVPPPALSAVGQHRAPPSTSRIFAKIAYSRHESRVTENWL